MYSLNRLTIALYTCMRELETIVVVEIEKEKKLTSGIKVLKVSRSANYCK